MIVLYVIILMIVVVSVPAVLTCVSLVKLEQFLDDIRE